MESKAHILASLREHRVPTVELPSLDGEWIEYDDPRSQFLETLEGVGGSGSVVSSLEEINQQLASMPAFADARQIVSVVKGIHGANVDLDDVEDPHDLEDIDFAIFPGQLAVAENAAVWVTDEMVRHRVLYFLAQHTALVVPASQLVHNMNQAYQQLEFPERRFGSFISGPSKTADIEQSLVIGAHGARSLHVFLFDG